MSKGIIYIFTNDAMPNFIKIGITTDLERRLRELDTTGIPLPFRCHYAIEIEDYDKKERFIHDAFADHRIRQNREFFTLAPERAVSMLKAIGGKEVQFGNNEMIDEEGNVVDDNKTEKKLRSAFTFSGAKIPVGSEIAFTRDENKKAKVISDKKVEYEGKEYSLSLLAQSLFEQIGYHWKSVQGPAYFKYDGEILSDRRSRLEEENSGDEAE